MTALEFAGSWHRHVLPFSLAIRLVGFTSPSSLLAAEYPAVQPTSQYAQALEASDFLAYTNQARTEHGLQPLNQNDQLTLAAHQKALDMLVNGYWDHYRPSDQKAPWDFIKESGYEYRVAGENLARGFSTPKGITEAWLASPTHRANVLSPHYTEVGFASIPTLSPEGETVLLTVQMFGQR